MICCKYHNLRKLYMSESDGQRETEKKRESDGQNDRKSEATAASENLLSCLITVSPARLTGGHEMERIHTRAQKTHRKT